MRGVVAGVLLATVGLTGCGSDGTQPANDQPSGSQSSSGSGGTGGGGGGY
jgi:hypothetical protein